MSTADEMLVTMSREDLRKEIVAGVEATAERLQRDGDPNDLLTIVEVAALLRMGQTTLRLKITETPGFPQPIKGFSRQMVWRRARLTKYIRKLDALAQRSTS